MEEYNPWWFGERDYVYEEFLKQPIRWIPPFLDEIRTDRFGLYFLVGPRQIGKTTALKIFIHDLLKKGTRPESIFYYSCDRLTTHDELYDLLMQYLDWRAVKGVEKSVIILDEITFVKEWYRSVKSVIDLGKVKNDTIIITGSTSFEVLKEKERFPGRRGAGKDLLYLPLQFSDYVKLFFKGMRVKEFQVEDDSYLENLPFKERLDRLFVRYLTTGGILKVINEYYRTGRVSQETVRTYTDWMIGDLIRMGMNETYLKEVIRYVIEAKGTPISWLSIAKNTSIRSPHTVHSYIRFLNQLYLVDVYEYIGLDGKVVHRKNKKIHPTDPFFYRVLSEYSSSEMDTPAKVEGTVAAHFSRKYPTYYWKGKSELDIVIKSENGLYGYEVKWGPKDWKKPRGVKSYPLDRETLPLFLGSYRF